MAPPRVSVLLPVRDARPWLEAALDSLARQTLAEHEVVAVDDGSVDGSGEMLLARAAVDARIRVLCQPARGLVAALQTGLAACAAPLVARMDADDVSHPRRLELQLRRLEESPRVGVVTCGVTLFPTSGAAEGFQLYVRWLNSLRGHSDMARERFVEAPVVHPSAVVRTAVLREAGGWRDVGWPEDYDLWLRLLEAGVRFARVDRPLLAWRDRPDRLTRTDARYAKRGFLACKAHFLARGPLAGRRALIWGAGPTGRELARRLLAERVRLESFVDVDRRLEGRIVRGVPVIGPGKLGERLSDDVVVLAAVAARGARALIRDRLEALGLVEGESYWCVA